MKNTNRPTKFITHNGETLSLAGWAKKLNVSVSTLRARVQLGWSDHDIVTREPHAGLTPGSHGQVGTRAYRAWQRMSSRCNNPNATQWKWYGGRGIKVCGRWSEFKNFFADMGGAPTDKHTIDRIDHNGNYEPGNCRWATMQEQQEHKRDRSDTVWLTHEGETLSVTEWAKRLGVSRHRLYTRLNGGWDIASVLTKSRHPGMSPGGWRILEPPTPRPKP